MLPRIKTWFKGVKGEKKLRNGLNQEWRLMSVIPALEKLRQDQPRLHSQFQGSLSYRVKTRKEGKKQRRREGRKVEGKKKIL